MGKNWTLNGHSFDYTATQIDGMPNGKICKKTMFCPTDIVRYTVVDSAGVALGLVHGMIWNEASSPSREVVNLW
jgi:hypothetical protein